MTAPRRFGSDTPFGEWVRKQKDLESRQCSMNLCDVDMMFQKYRTDVDTGETAGLDPRDVQLCMLVEVKTFGAEPTGPQREILFYHHQLLRHKRKLKRIGNLPSVSVWHYGVFVLRLRGTYPEEGIPMLWGQFDACGNLHWKDVSRVWQLKEILGFNWYPDTLEPLKLRRHHKLTPLLCKERLENGIEAETVVVRRS